MSHIVRIQTKIHDPVALAVACRRLGVGEPVHGIARLFSGEVAGLLVQLPDWRYLTVIDTASGTVKYDNYEGSWGDQKHLDRLIQLYSVEKARIEAKKKGFHVSEQSLQDGSILLRVQECY